jgi:hypothetical protein
LHHDIPRRKKWLGPKEPHLVIIHDMKKRRSKKKRSKKKRSKKRDVIGVLVVTKA